MAIIQPNAQGIRLPAGLQFGAIQRPSDFRPADIAGILATQTTDTPLAQVFRAAPGVPGASSSSGSGARSERQATPTRIRSPEKKRSRSVRRIDPSELDVERELTGRLPAAATGSGCSMLIWSLKTLRSRM